MTSRRKLLVHGTPTSSCGRGLPRGCRRSRTRHQGRCFEVEYLQQRRTVLPILRVHAAHLLQLPRVVRAKQFLSLVHAFGELIPYDDGFQRLCQIPLRLMCVEKSFTNLGIQAQVLVNRAGVLL